ncbi:hypothetical protein ENBRE01_2316 [Enteropsectra breve]|nr:hypothetical protein ENBRE01_2316 [Enteropsectra breve]
MIGTVNLVLAMIAYGKCASQDDETHLHAPLAANAPVSQVFSVSQVSPVQPQTEEHPVATPGRKDDVLNKTTDSGLNKTTDSELNKTTYSELNKTTVANKKLKMQIIGQNEAKWSIGFYNAIRTLNDANIDFMESINLRDYCLKLDSYYKINGFRIESAFMIFENEISGSSDHLGPLCHMLALLNGVFELDKNLLLQDMKNTMDCKKRYNEAKKALGDKMLSDEDKEKLLKLENEIIKSTDEENTRYNYLFKNISLSIKIVDWIIKHSQDAKLTEEAYSIYIDYLNGSYQNAYDELQEIPFYKLFFEEHNVKPSGEGQSTFDEKHKVEENPVNSTDDDTKRNKETPVVPAKPDGASAPLQPPELQETEANENKKVTQAKIDDLTKQRANILAGLTEAKNYIMKLKNDVLETSMKLESDKKMIDEKHNAAPENEVLKKMRDTSEPISNNLKEFILEIAANLEVIENRIAALGAIDANYIEQYAAAIASEETKFSAIQEELPKMNDMFLRYSELFSRISSELNSLLESERKELEKKELERKELERKELERKELERKELERKELERKELERKELERKELEKDGENKDGSTKDKNSIRKFFDKHTVKVIIGAVTIALLVICGVVLIRTMGKDSIN